MRKKLFLVTLMVFLCSMAVRCADFLSIENAGEASIQPNRIIQNLTVKSKGGQVTLSVFPLDSEIVNLQSPNIKIPVSNIYMASKEASLHQLNYGKSTVLINNGPALSQEHIKLIIENTGYLRAGTYSTRLEFKNTDVDDSATSVYVLSINIPKEQDIFSDTSDVNIKIDGNKVFTPNLSTINEVSPRMNIKSNVPWSLYIDTAKMSKNEGEYYFQIKSKSPEVSEFEEQRTLLEPNKKYWIASGNPTAGTFAQVQVEYLHKNTGSKYSRPGMSNSAFKYIIEEKK